MVIKPWPNGLASRRKSTRVCDLRSTCVLFGHGFRYFWCLLRAIELTTPPHVNKNKGVAETAPFKKCFLSCRILPCRAVRCSVCRTCRVRYQVCRTCRAFRVRYRACRARRANCADLVPTFVFPYILFTMIRPKVLKSICSFIESYHKTKHVNNGNPCQRRRPRGII